jgi:hypothetical protein
MKKRLNSLTTKVKGHSVWQNPQQRTVALLFVALFAVVGFYTITRSLAATGNDLVVTAISLNPSTPGTGSAVTFSATVKNQGTTAVPAGTLVGVSFALDGTRVTWSETNTAGLAAGASVNLTATAGTTGATWAATTGPHTVVATADDTNAIPDESNEGNNTLSKTFTIGSTGSLYQSPATRSVNINTSFTESVRLTPNTTVDGVSATLTYDQTKLQFVSVDVSNSPFDVQLGTASGGNGTVTMNLGNLSGGVSTDALVATVTFKALAGSGTTIIQTTGNATKNGGYTNPATSNATITLTTPDTTPPAVSITSPTTGANSWLTQSVTASATDAIGVTKVEFYVDGLLKATDTATPYTYSLDTTTLSNANHTLTVKGYDAAGNVGTSSGVTIAVRNWPEDINQDGTVNILDFSLLAGKFGQSDTTLGRTDINQDGTVNILDFSLLAGKFGQ